VDAGATDDDNPQMPRGAVRGLCRHRPPTTWGGEPTLPI